jgi:regulatory protein
MEITAIQPNKTIPNRYSVFIDEKFSFAVSDTKLLDLKIAVGDKVNTARLEEFIKEADEDKIYGQALRYVSMRLKSEWQVKEYLKKKGASPPLVDIILNKLSELNLVNDISYAKAFVSDKSASFPSRRKLEFELLKKHVNKEVIEEVLSSTGTNEKTALKKLIDKKRTKYPDKVKLMQYLSRQGFNYGDIKEAIED